MSCNRKIINTLSEIRSRNGPIVAIGHSDVIKSECEDAVVVPRSHPLLDPILLLLPLQLVAYYAAIETWLRCG